MKMQTAAIAILGLLALCPCLTAHILDIVRQAAESWTGNLPCERWNCECAYDKLQGCCCVAAPLFQLEEATLKDMMDLKEGMFSLNKQIEEVTGGPNIAFAATLVQTAGCFGPFSRSVSISYQNVSLNQGYGYNTALGVFTAPQAGLYSFTYSCYSNLGPAGERIYHKVQLMKDTQIIASSWEDNREDSEDSSTQTVLLQLNQGNQVYIELMAGRVLCGDTQGHNSFSGYLIYPVSKV